jgi:hypothetical protein
MIIDSPIISGSSVASGSYTQTGNVTITGSLIVTGGITGSISGSAISASYATTASYWSGSITNATSASYSLTASYSNTSTTASYVASVISASYAATASYVLTAQTASYWSGSITNALSASYAASASNASNTALFNSTASAVFATTGSNNFTGVTYHSNTNNAIGFSSTTSSIYTDGGLQVTKDVYVSSSLYIKGNLTVYGTQSVSYITSSTLNISTNLITVNTSTPAVRFGGIAVQDSGSTAGLTGSLLWDSQNNSWLYDNPSGSGNYDSAMVIMGPRNASALGSEQGLNCNYLIQGHGHHHTTSSGIFHDGTNTCIPNTLIGSTVCAGTFDSNCARLIGKVSASPYANSSWLQAPASSGMFIVNSGITNWIGIKADGSIDSSGTFTHNGRLNIFGTGNSTSTTTYGLVVDPSGGGVDNFYVRDDGMAYLRNILLINKSSTAIAGNSGAEVYSGVLTAHSCTGNGVLNLNASQNAPAANIGGQINFDAVYRSSDCATTTIARIKGFREDNTSNFWKSYISFETTNASDGYTISEKMRITSGGNVGIGSIAPTNLLHLCKPSGTISMTLQTSCNYGYFYNDGTNIGLASDIGATGLKFIVNRNSPDCSLIVCSTGTVYACSLTVGNKSATRINLNIDRATKVINGFNATSSGARWLRIGCFNARTTYMLNMNTTGNYYTPGSTTALIFRDWGNSFFSQTLGKLGTQYVYCIRMQSDNVGGDYAVEVWYNAIDPNQLSGILVYSAAALSADADSILMCLGSYGTDAANSSVTTSAIAF